MRPCVFFICIQKSNDIAYSIFHGFFIGYGKVNIGSLFHELALEY